LFGFLNDFRDFLCCASDKVSEKAIAVFKKVYNCKAVARIRLGIGGS
jgi:hypothetical protein